MSRSPFDPRFEELPDQLPVFPLSGVLLLPGGRLPLNIFEPRYIKMVDDALAGARLIGMVQPQEADPQDNRGAGAERPALYRAGCAGRITAFNEADDGRYMMTLTGLIRFNIAEELVPSGYRLVRPDFAPFRADLRASDCALDRKALFAVLRGYFDAKALDADWESIEQADGESLVTSLAMACPLDPAEKQLLLEAETVTKRVEMLTAIMEMAIHSHNDGAPRH